MLWTTDPRSPHGIRPATGADLRRELADVKRHLRASQERVRDLEALHDDSSLILARLEAANIKRERADRALAAAFAIERRTRQLERRAGAFLVVNVAMALGLVLAAAGLFLGRWAP